MFNEEEFQRANDLFSKGEYVDALDIYIPIYNSIENKQDINKYILGSLSHLDLNLALKYCDDLIDADSMCVDAYNFKALIFIKHDMHQGALDYINMSLEIEPENFMLNLIKLQEYVKLECRDDYNKHLDDLMENHPVVFTKILLFNLGLSPKSIDEEDLDSLLLLLDDSNNDSLKEFLQENGGVEGLLKKLYLEGHSNDEIVDFKHHKGILYNEIDSDIPADSEDYMDEEYTYVEIAQELKLVEKEFKYIENPKYYLLSGENEDIVDFISESENSYDEYSVGLLDILKRYIYNQKGKMADFLKDNFNKLINDQFDEVVLSINQMFKENPKEEGLIIFKGFLYLLNLLNFDAIFIVGMLDEEDSIYESLLIKGFAYSRIKHELAYVYFDKALKIYSEDIEVWLSYIQLATEHGDFEMALELRGQMEKKFPNFKP